MTFQEWLKEVDKYIARECGLGHDDLADQLWYDWYDSDMTPEEAAVEALDNEGFYDFVFGGDDELARND